MASRHDDLEDPVGAADSPGGDSIAGGRSKRDASSTAGSPDSAGAAKKRAKKAPGPGARGVANLTAEQLTPHRDRMWYFPVR
jgi:hypothetical protein